LVWLASLRSMLTTQLDLSDSKTTLPDSELRNAVVACARTESDPFPFHQNPRAAASNALSEACARRVSGVTRLNLCDRLLDKHARRNGGAGR